VPHGPVAALTSCPQARITVTAAPAANAPPNSRSSSPGKASSAAKAGSDSRTIHPVTAA
jgi:hypothetical protein